MIRRTTYATVEMHAAKFKDKRLQYDALPVACGELRRRLQLHSTGAASCRAADIFQQACMIAALALWIAENGCDDFNYARAPTGQVQMDV